MINIPVQFNNDSEFNVEVSNNHEYELLMDEYIESTAFNADHTALINREKPNQHPIGAITNLNEELDIKVNTNNVIPDSDIINL